MKFFTDENISEHLARMIACFDRANDICIHCDHFEKGTRDDVWVPRIAAWEPKPVVVLGDGRLLRNPGLKLIAKESQFSYVVMGESFMRTAWTDQAWKLVKVWPDVVKATQHVRRPTIFDVKISSLKVQPRHATSELR